MLLAALLTLPLASSSRALSRQSRSRCTRSPIEQHSTLSAHSPPSLSLPLRSCTYARFRAYLSPQRATYGSRSGALSCLTAPAARSKRVTRSQLALSRSRAPLLDITHTLHSLPRALPPLLFSALFSYQSLFHSYNVGAPATFSQDGSPATSLTFASLGFALASTRLSRTFTRTRRSPRRAALYQRPARSPFASLLLSLAPARSSSSLVYARSLSAPRLRPRLSLRLVCRARLGTPLRSTDSLARCSRSSQYSLALRPSAPRRSSNSRRTLSLASPFYAALFAHHTRSRASSYAGAHTLASSDSSLLPP